MCFIFMNVGKTTTFPYPFHELQSESKQESHSMGASLEVDFFPLDSGHTAGRSKDCIWIHGKTPLSLPCQDLIVSILKVPILLFSDRIYQLIFMKIDNLSNMGQIWT